MTQPGYQPGSEPVWWWKVAMHLDEAQIALANAMAHNLDDPKPVFVLQDRLTEGQAILLEIFRAKGLLPGSTNGKAEVPMPGMSGGGGGGLGGEVQIATATEPAVAEADRAAAAEPEPPSAVPPPEAAAPAEIAPDAPSTPPAGVGG